MSKFPNEIDTDAELPSVIDGSSEISGEVINAHKDAIIAVEKTIGTNPQGSAATLADRLAVSINADGTLNADAIAASWLLSAPITNAQVGAAAAIDESKLNLDVPTANLQDQISDLVIDVEALQEAVDPDIARLASHIAGTADRHQAQHIIVSPQVAAASNSQAALQNIYSALTTHIANPVAAHDADAISYAPAQGSNLTATSVGGALDEIDSNFINRVNRHLDTAHSNGISSDGYVYLDGQGSVNGASLAGVPLLPINGQTRIKLGGINHATIISRGANPAALGASASKIIIDYSDGYSLYTTEISGLNSCPYPTGSENRLRGAVTQINNSLRAAGALVTAFHFKNEIIFQHNTPDGYLSIRSPSAASAVSALGFADVVGQRSFPISHFISVTDGIPLDAWEPLASGNMSLSAPSLSISISSAIAAGALVHITNHTGLGGGTYQAVAVAGNNITLNRPVPAGSFSYTILPDSIGIGSTSIGTTYDVFADRYGAPLAVSRAEVTVSQISGVRMSACDLQAGTYTLSTTGTGASCRIKLNSGLYSGQEVSVPNGYLGQVVVKAPRGLGSATLDIVSLTPTSPATDTITVTKSSQNDNLQRLFGYWSNGSSVEYPVDLRNIGLVDSSSLASDVFSKTLAEFPSNRMNGLVSGDAVTVSGTVLQIPRSRCLINGAMLDSEPVSIDFFAVPFAAGIYNLYIDSSGCRRLALESSASGSLQSILARKEVPLARVTYTSTPSLQAIDTRLFSLPVFPSDGLIVGGDAGTYHCWNLEGALALATAGSVGLIKLQADQSTSYSLVVPPGMILSGPVSLTCNSITLSSGASIDLRSLTTTTLTETGVSAADTGRISVRDLTTRSVELSNYSSLDFLNAVLTGAGSAPTPTLVISGSGVSVSGSAPGAAMSFATNGVVTISGAYDLRLSDFAAVFASTAFDWINISGTCSNFTIDGLSAYKSGAISAYEISSHSVFSASSTAVLQNIFITGGSFEECGRILSSQGAISSLSITGCSGSNFGGILNYKSGSSSTGSVVSDFYGYRMSGNLLELSGAANVSLSDSVFSGTFGAAPAQARAFYSTGSASGISANISKCVFSGIPFLDYLVYAPEGSSAVLNLSDCNFSAVTSSISQATRTAVAGNLVNWASSGLLRVSGCTMTGCSFKIAAGHNIELSNNDIQLTTTANKLELFYINSPLTNPADPAYTRSLATLDNNTIRVSSGKSRMQIGSSSLYGNNIIADEFIFDHGVLGAVAPNAAGYVIDGNIFESNDAAATPTTFSIYPGYMVNGNRFYGSGTGGLLKLGVSALGKGFLKFSENVCVYDVRSPSGSSSIIEVSDGSSGVLYTLSGNLIQLANADGYSVSTAIQIANDNVVCYQNSIIGDGITGTIFGGAGTPTGCRIVGNSVTGGSADGENLPDDNVFEDNHGVRSTYAINPMNGTGGSLSATGIALSSTITWIPINARTGNLLEVAVDFYIPTSAGSQRVYVLQLITTDSAGQNADVVGGSATLTVPIGFTGHIPISVIPTSIPYIGPSKTAAVRITFQSGTTGGVNLRNTRAVIKS